MPARLAPLFLVFAIIFAGCGRDEVTSYRVPKETSLAVPGLNAPATPEGGGMLTWNAPDHWNDLGATGMRRGSFAIEGENGQTADLSVIAFPGNVGGLAANVNRWRGQVGLPALTPAEIDASVEHTDTAHFHIDIVTMTGQSNGEPTRIDGAIFSFGTESWFIKLMGPADLVAAENANFRAFVASVAPAQD